MADGHRQIHGNSSAAIDHFCRDERADNFVTVVILTPIILGFGLYWVNEGNKDETVKIKNKRR